MRRELTDKVYVVLAELEPTDRSPWDTPVRLARCGCCGAMLGRVARAAAGDGPATHLQTMPGFRADDKGTYYMTAHQRRYLQRRHSYGTNLQLVRREWVALPVDFWCPGRTDEWGRPGRQRGDKPGLHLQRADGTRLHIVAENG